jgi:flagellar capping protein FliD
MEFKVNITQILGSLVQAIAYAVVVLSVVWRVSKRVANMEHQIKSALEKIAETNERMEKTFDKIDKTFERMEDKLEKRGR